MTELQRQPPQPANELAQPRPAPGTEGPAARAVAPGAPRLDARSLLAMQAIEGNRAVQRMLAGRARRPTPATRPPALQRHPEHAAPTPEPAEQHRVAAQDLLKQSVAQLPEARAEIEHAKSHDPGSAAPAPAAPPPSAAASATPAPSAAASATPAPPKAAPPKPAPKSKLTRDIGVDADWIAHVMGLVARVEAARGAKDYDKELRFWNDIGSKYRSRLKGGWEGAPVQAEIFDAIREGNEHLRTQTDVRSDAPHKERYLDRGQELFNSGDFVHAAVLWERVYAQEPSVLLAFEIGQSYKAGGDKERAAPWYRKLLEQPELGARARTALEGMGMPLASKFTATKAVDLQDTSVSDRRLGLLGKTGAEATRMKESGLAAEEQGADDLGNEVLEILGKVLYGEYTPADAQRSLADFMGVTEHSVKELLLDYLRYKAAKSSLGGLDLERLERLYPDIRPEQVESGGYEKLQSLLSARVSYLKTSDARAPYKLVREGGLIKQGNPPGPASGYDTKDQSTNASGKGYAIYVMGGDGDIYANTHKVSRFHHSSFLAGAEAAGAGELKVTSGEIKAITNKSGHYKPGFRLLAQSIKQLRELGSVGGATLVYHYGESQRIDDWEGGPDDFVASAEDPSRFNTKLKKQRERQG